MVGMNTSRMLNVAAAVKAIIIISSTFNCFFGIANAANATTKPSIKYFIARFTNSFKSSILPYIILQQKNTKLIEQKRFELKNQWQDNINDIHTSNCVANMKTVPTAGIAEFAKLVDGASE